MTSIFQKNNKFHKIFNRNNVKVSYSCLPNFANIIKLRNNRILSEESTQDQPKCNCCHKDTFPLERHCFDKELRYQCILKENTTSDRVNYNGLTENTFKDRFYKPCNSFKYESKTNSTEFIDKELIYRCILKENITYDRVNCNGLTENTFKDRFYKPCNSLKYESKANFTELSKHFW